MKRNEKFKPKAAIVMIALSTILGGQSALASAVANSPSYAQQQQVNYKSNEVQIASAGDFAYSKEATEALAYLNDIRKKMGLQEVKLNPYLVKSAENHVKYLTSNNLGSASGHDEVKGNKYFTGETVQARAEAAGADVMLAQELSEGISNNASTTTKAIDNLLNTAYHRTHLVNENLSEFGVGISGNTAVFVYTAQNSTSDTSVYPYDGQKEVPLSFYGATESPNPLTQFGVSSTGYIISASVPYVIDTKKVDATIKNSKGEIIPYYSHFKLQWFLFPKAELKPNETYTVSLNYVVKNGPDEGKKINKTWSFTTKSGGTTTPPPTTPPTKPVDPTNPTKPPVTTGKYNKDNVGVEINGKFVTLSPKAKIVDGSTFIPLRGVFEELNSSLIWNGKEQSVTITRGTTKVKLTIGSKIAYIDGTKVTLSVAPFIDKVSQSTYVPLRFASEAIGADVKWDQTNYVATITTE